MLDVTSMTIMKVSVYIENTLVTAVPVPPQRGG